ncbi:hypothetical protein DAPPUDRAFT_234135 [Daphnia pulex]|uniref:Uncharacterized protein n=1 Tax=Daphnia pulex TaxID=6669 RepID=E9FUN4_DAPPU|nr:hypothetical protein DAPPUDRAFT_234135 [Daphnia pulex]|eukprot:EFX88895.1 hypothetical protein DAPPUDRAFT_234135 [Daphnia pulex]
MTMMKTLAKKLPTMRHTDKTRRVIPKSRTFQLKMASWMIIDGLKVANCISRAPARSIIRHKDSKTHFDVLFYSPSTGIKTELADERMITPLFVHGNWRPRGKLDVAQRLTHARQAGRHQAAIGGQERRHYAPSRCAKTFAAPVSFSSFTVTREDHVTEPQEIPALAYRTFAGPVLDPRDVFNKTSRVAIRYNVLQQTRTTNTLCIHGPVCSLTLHVPLIHPACWRVENDTGGAESPDEKTPPASDGRAFAACVLPNVFVVHTDLRSADGPLAGPLA